MVFAPFRSGTGVDFTHFLSGIGYGFRGLRGCMDVFVVSIPSERRSNMLIRNGF